MSRRLAIVIFKFKFEFEIPPYVLDRSFGLIDKVLFRLFELADDVLVEQIYLKNILIKLDWNSIII